MEDVRTEIRRNLETVRSERGLSLAAFWEAVVGKREAGFEWADEEGEPYYSYRAMTRYHNGSRLAPSDYLLRVSRVFDVPIQWLLTGEGPDTKLAGMRWIPHPLHRRLEDESSWFADQPMGVKWAFLDLLHLYQQPTGRRGAAVSVEKPGSFDVDVERARDLEDILHLPLYAWGYDGDLSRVPRSYWRSAIGALHDAVWALIGGSRRDLSPTPRGEPFVAHFMEHYRPEED